MKEKFLEDLPKSKQQALYKEFKYSSKKIKFTYSAFLLSALSMLAMFVYQIFFMLGRVETNGFIGILSILLFIIFAITAINFMVTVTNKYYKWLKNVKGLSVRNK